MPFTPGYEEDGFLKSLGLKKDDLEPLADNCTKVSRPPPALEQEPRPSYYRRQLSAQTLVKRGTSPYDVTARPDCT